MSMVWNDEEARKKEFDAWITKVQGDWFHPATKNAFNIWVAAVIRMQQAQNHPHKKKNKKK